MMYLLIKALLSGIIVMVVSEVAKRNPSGGALIASLPLISILGMIWLWSETHDRERMASHAAATFWYVLPSLPMFLLVPVLLRLGVNFWVCLALGCLLTVALYLLTMWLLPKLGIAL